jgi:hypothetical protein
MPRLSHYFLPGLLFAKKQILYLDGANQISPLLLARFARERGGKPPRAKRGTHREGLVFFLAVDC